MDYGRLNRRELQALCKQHGIPANKTNVFMAEALTALLKEPKERKVTEELATDPAEVVKSKDTRTQAKNSATDDALAPAIVDDLSSHLARSTISCDLGSDTPPVLLAPPATKPRSRIARKPSKARTIADIYYADPESVENMEVEAASETAPNVVQTSAAETGAQLAATDVEDIDFGPRGRARLKQFARRGPKLNKQPVDATVEHSHETMASENDNSERILDNEEMSLTLEVVLPSPVLTDAENGSELVSKTLARFVAGNADRMVGMETQEESIVPAPVECKPTKKGRPRGKTSKTENSPLAAVPVGEVDNEEAKPSESPPQAAVESPIAESIVVDVMPPTKKFVKGRKAKKASSPSVETAPLHPMQESHTGVADTTKELRIQIPDSPAFILPLATDAVKGVEAVESSKSDMEEDNVAFEFRPVPSSFAEIMSPVRPVRKLDVIDVQLGDAGHPALVKVCQHRVKSRPGKGGKQCSSCESERKVVTIMHEVLDAIDLPVLQQKAPEDNQPLTPVKLVDDKENAVDLELHSMSIRKLQKEIQKKTKAKKNPMGLSTRTNTAQSLPTIC